MESTHKSDYGEFKWTAGNFYGDAEKDKGKGRVHSVILHFNPLFPGIQTSQNAKFYARCAKFDQFTNEGKTLVIQFTVKHEQKMDCGGGYVKVGEN